MPETTAHAERVGRYAQSVAREMGVEQRARRRRFELAARFHDIGKSGDARRAADEALPADAEAKWRSCGSTSTSARRSCEATGALASSAPLVLTSHEWFNGGGYPRRLAGAVIPLATRIIAVVDAYDAMTQDRSYRPGSMGQDAIAELLRCTPTQFDPRDRHRLPQRPGQALDNLASCGSRLADSGIRAVPQPDTSLACSGAFYRPDNSLQYNDLTASSPRLARSFALYDCAIVFSNSFRLSTQNNHGYCSPVQCEEEADPPGDLRRRRSAGRRARQRRLVAAQAGGADGRTRGGLARHGETRADGAPGARPRHARRRRTSGGFRRPPRAGSRRSSCGRARR